MFFDPAIIATLKLKEAPPKPLKDGHNDGDLRSLQEEKRVMRRSVLQKHSVLQWFRGSRKTHS